MIAASLHNDRFPLHVLHSLFVSIVKSIPVYTHFYLVVLNSADLVITITACLNEDTTGPVPNLHHHITTQSTIVLQDSLKHP